MRKESYILDAVNLFYLGKLLYLLNQLSDSIKKYFLRQVSCSPGQASFTFLLYLKLALNS